MNTKPVITPIRTYFVRGRYCFDLVDLRRYIDRNQGYKWLLVGLDSFSKYSWTAPLKAKSADFVVNAIKDIIMAFDLQ